MKNTSKRLIASVIILAVMVSILSGKTAPRADAAYGVGGNNNAIMEYLNRGTYAIKSGNGMFISWRYNANDDDDATFMLYRDGELIYTSEEDDPTNYWDPLGNADSEYCVDTLRDGEVINSEICYLTSGTNYFDIPLDVPKSGKTPAGETYTYSPNDCQAADVDGDGQYEIFVKWDPSNSKDNSQSGYTGNVYIDCYSLNGEKLWRIDLGKNIRAGQHYTQLAVADFDCDGYAELVTKTADGTIDGTGTVIGDANANNVDDGGRVLTGSEYITLFDGMSGEALHTINFPVPRGVATGTEAKNTWGDNYGNRCERYNCAIAYLDGIHPSIVYNRGYYTRMSLSALDVKDGTLVRRWIFDTGFDKNNPAYGNGNHNVMVADVDNDGRQEICMGACTIDDNGTLLWSTKKGHGDAMHLGDLDPNREGFEEFLCHESGSYGISLIDAKNGQIIWHHDGDKDTGRCCADNIFKDNPGAEFWGARPAYSVFNTQGTQIGSTPPAMNFLIYWDGDLEREILDDINISKMVSTSDINTIFTASGCASNNGTKAVPCMVGDLFGDWREELVLRTEDNSKLRIWCTNTESPYRITTLMHDMQYRMQNGCQQSSYNQPPHTSFYLGTGLPLPEKPRIKLNSTPPENERNSSIADFNVLDGDNAASWQVSSSSKTGSLIYGDRDYTYASLPEKLEGKEAIITACNSKNTFSDLAQFTAATKLDVYILLDSRVEDSANVPEWLNNYTKTDMTATSSNDVTFNIYTRTFEADEKVVLGQNGMSGNCMNYTVFVDSSPYATVPTADNNDTITTAPPSDSGITNTITPPVTTTDNSKSNAPKLIKKKGLYYRIVSNEKKTAAFAGAANKKIKKIVIASKIKFKGVTYKVTKIDSGACSKYKKLKKLSLGKNIKKVGRKAFYRCKALKKVNGLSRLKNMSFKTFYSKYVLGK